VTRPTQKLVEKMEPYLANPPQIRDRLTVRSVATVPRTGTSIARYQMTPSITCVTQVFS